MPKEDWAFCAERDKQDRQCNSKVVHNSLFCSFHSMRRLAAVEICSDCKGLLKTAGLLQD